MFPYSVLSYTVRIPEIKHFRLTPSSHHSAILASHSSAISADILLARSALTTYTQVCIRLSLGVNTLVSTIWKQSRRCKMEVIEYAKTKSGVICWSQSVRPRSIITSCIYPIGLGETSWPARLGPGDARFRCKLGV